MSFGDNCTRRHPNRRPFFFPCGFLRRDDPPWLAPLPRPLDRLPAPLEGGRLGVVSNCSSPCSAAKSEEVEAGVAAPAAGVPARPRAGVATWLRLAVRWRLLLPSRGVLKPAPPLAGTSGAEWVNGVVAAASPGDAKEKAPERDDASSCCTSAASPCRCRFLLRRRDADDTALPGATDDDAAVAVDVRDTTDVARLGREYAGPPAAVAVAAALAAPALAAAPPAPVLAATEVSPVAAGAGSPTPRPPRVARGVAVAATAGVVALVTGVAGCSLAAAALAAAAATLCRRWCTLGGNRRCRAPSGTSVLCPHTHRSSCDGNGTAVTHAG